MKVYPTIPYMMTGIMNLSPVLVVAATNALALFYLNEIYIVIHYQGFR
jgi:hypothetical protein